MSITLTPREIVAELDKYIVGQHDAKRMVGIAMRNRWRRQQLPKELREEVTPKNIIMIGPTGVGKTEIARRLAKLCGSPFIKVEATKYTEVGYVGRDVESMIRDLMEIGVSMVKAEQSKALREQAEENAEESLLNLLLPPPNFNSKDSHFPREQVSETNPSGTREKLRDMLRKGKLEEREIEMQIESNPSDNIELMGIPGMEAMGDNIRGMFAKIMPPTKSNRKMTIKNAREILINQESEKLLDQDKLISLAKDRVEQTGVVFLDEIDKIANPDGKSGSTDVSRQGVQRDILPIVEGSVVSTKYGSIKTDHILFIAAGAFHFSKPSDLMPELQGRFPLRVELNALTKEDFLRILTEPENALTKQYEALLDTEKVKIAFKPEALEEIARFAEDVNRETENIGARRLYTIMEKIIAELSFNAPDMPGYEILIDSNYVRSQLKDIETNSDLTRYIL